MARHFSSYFILCTNVMNTPKRPSVVALILTYDDADLVQSRIRSVQAGDYPNLSIFLVDNGSHADVAGTLRQAIPPTSSELLSTVV